MTDSISNGMNTTKITIKKGQGITQALKEHIEKNKMKLSDENISKTEWSNTIKVLDNIQSTRKAQNGKSIFGNGYIVHEGDNIDFTAEEMNKIYEAMGVEIENPTQTTETAHPTTQQAQTTPQPDHAATQQVQTTPPAQTVTNNKTNYTYIGERNLPEGCTFKQEGDRTVTYDKNGKKLFSRQYAGVGEINNKTFNTTYYDANGNTTGTAECKLKDDGYITYQFKDKDGNSLGSAKVSGGRQEIIITDANGKEIKHTKSQLYSKEMTSQIMDDMFETFPFEKAEATPQTSANTPTKPSQKPQQTAITPEQELQQLTEALIDKSKIKTRQDSKLGTCWSCWGHETNMGEQQAKNLAKLTFKTLVEGKKQYIELSKKNPKDLTDDEKLEVFAYKDLLQETQLVIDSNGNLAKAENCEFI